MNRGNIMIKNSIGDNAGTIWKALNENPDLSIMELKNLTRLNDKDTYLALGWLSRENKIVFLENKKGLKLSLTGN